MRFVEVEVEKPEISAEARRWCPAEPREDGGLSDDVLFESGVLFRFEWLADMMAVSCFC